MLNDASHNEIWERLRKGDHQALLDLYETFYLGLINYGLKVTGDRALTLECIAQVLIKLWDKHALLPPVSNPRIYLATCLRNELFTALKSETTRLARSKTIGNLSGEAEPSYEEYLIKWQTSRMVNDKLQKAIHQLTGREKELLELRFFEDLDYDEIASRCHITKRTAYNIIHAALKTLKARLTAATTGITSGETAFSKKDRFL